MRIALLSILDEASARGRARASFASFAGAMVVERQLDLAVALGCETAACLVDAVGPEVLALQHRAERAGVRFLPLRDPRGLSGVVSADDELVVIGAGVLPDEEAVLRHATKAAVLVFPADVGVPLGFERIDAEFAWSGVLVTRGAMVERLADLPTDSDVPSALLRIALQGGTRIHPLGRHLLAEGLWHRDATAEQLADREARWIRRHSAATPYSAPGLAVADRMGSRLATDILGTRLMRVPWLLAALVGMVSLALAVFGWPGVGVGLLALAALLAAIGRALERIASAGRVGAEPSLASRLSQWLVDPLLLGLLAAASPEDTGWLRLFVPGVLLGLLHFGERFAPQRWRPSYADRIALAFLLAPPALFGFAQSASALLSLAALVSLFFAFTRTD